MGRNPRAPFIYHVWESGETEPLPNEMISCRDPGWRGRTFTADLLKWKDSDQPGAFGDLRVRVESPPNPRDLRKFDWSITVEAASGG